MNKLFLIFGSIGGALAVALGAFAAHQLKQTMTAQALEVFETAVRYQFYHVFALLLVGILTERMPGKWMNRSGSLFIAGILLFSGSLYIISGLMSAGISVPVGLGLLTPLGGLCFISGWFLLTIGVLKARAS